MLLAFPSAGAKGDWDFQISDLVKKLLFMVPSKGEEISCKMGDSAGYPLLRVDDIG